MGFFSGFFFFFLHPGGCLFFCFFKGVNTRPRSSLHGWYGTTEMRYAHACSSSRSKEGEMSWILPPPFPPVPPCPPPTPHPPSPS